MVFDPTTPMQAIQTQFASAGYFPSVIIGEPKSPPDAMTVALFWMDLGLSQTDLTGDIEVWHLTARIYAGANIFDPMENLELGLGKAVAQALVLLGGHFTLGGSVRAIDWAGEEGSKVGVKWGHGDVSGTMFRLADIDIPLIVDDAVTFAA